MKYSLPSRELIADSIEIMAQAHPFDGLVLLGSCDKIIPGMLIAATRLNLPAIFVSGGPMLPGRVKGREVGLDKVFEAVGERAVGRITDEDLLEMEDCACPGVGSCAGLYTANTMSNLAEALGIACSYVANYKPNMVTRILQNLLYSISDTASSSWGAFEGVSEIISQRFDLYGSYTAYLYPFLKDETKKEMSLEAIARISKRNPKALRKLTLHFIPFLKDPNPLVRAHAIRLMGYLGAFEVKEELRLLAGDETRISFYDMGKMNERSLGELAREAMEAIGR
jgi:hypothetical protein